MEKILNLLLKIHIVFLAFIGSCKSQQVSACPPPDYPVGGSYHPKQSKFQPGDSITYTCEPFYTLMGKDTSKCKSNGDWTNPTPFCDRKVPLKNPHAVITPGVRVLNPHIIDGDKKTCFSLQIGEKIVVNMDKLKEVYAVRMFLGSGASNIEIYTGRYKCVDSFVKYLETSQWVMVTCRNNDELTNLITIQDKSPNRNNSTICELEVYVKEEDGCEYPPSTKIANGYFEVSRSKARLICEEGYQSAYNRLVCEGNIWKGNKLHCQEILCDPLINSSRPQGSEWVFLDAVKKISAGTRRQLKCSVGYKMIGRPDLIVCYKNGTWTKTNATCIEEKNLKLDTRTIVFGVVGTIVVILIIILLATTIYFVRKQRNRPVVVVYKSPTEGSVISGSSGDYASPYYETIQADAPQPPTTSRPTANMLQDRYFLPLDNRDTMKKKQQPTPADIAFGTLKSSTLYGC